MIDEMKRELRMLRLFLAGACQTQPDGKLRIPIAYTNAIDSDAVVLRFTKRGREFEVTMDALSDLRPASPSAPHAHPD
jgi:hypothetical protein